MQTLTDDDRRLAFPVQKWPSADKKKKKIGLFILLWKHLMRVTSVHNVNAALCSSVLTNG